MKPKFTLTQGQYLVFIDNYTRVHGRPPSEADMLEYFRTSPPSVHQMVLTLERRGLITRVAGKPRSIRVLVPPSELSPLNGAASTTAPSKVPPARHDEELALRLAQRTVAKMFERNGRDPLDDSEFAPLVQCVADAVEEDLCAGGDRERARAARERVLAFAVELYVKLCAENDPEEANADEDEEVFRHLMSTGKWP